MASFKVQCSAPDDAKHIGDIECITRHGDKIYTGAGDGMIKVWSLDLKPAGEVQAHDLSVYHVAVSPDGKRLLSCSNDGSIKTWTLPGLEPGPTISGHIEAVRRIRFTPDGTLYSGDEAGIVCVQPPEAGAKAKKYDLMGGEIWDLVVDGDTMYSARDRDLVVSQIKENVKGVICNGMFPGRSPICVLPGLVFFVSREGSDVLVHHDKNNKYEKITELKGHEMIINALAASESGKLLFSGGFDNSVRVWDVAAREGLTEVPLDAYVNCLIAGPGESVYAGGANSLLVQIVKE